MAILVDIHPEHDTCRQRIRHTSRGYYIDRILEILNVRRKHPVLHTVVALKPHIPGHLLEHRMRLYEENLVID